MLKILFIVGVYFSVSLAQQSRICDTQRCGSRQPNLAMLDNFPTPEQMLLSCPSSRETLDCFFEEFRRCVGHDVESQVSSNNATVAGEATILMGIKSVLTDICDTSSRLHRAYSENYECLKNVINNDRIATGVCFHKTTFWYLRYKDRTRSRDTSDVKCLIAGKTLECIAKEVGDTCGEEAEFFVIESKERTKYMDLKLCTSHQINQLQNSYLDLGYSMKNGFAQLTCDTQRCGSNGLNTILDNYPTPAQVLLSCPSSRETLDCFFEEFRGCVGHDVESQVSSSNATIAGEAAILMGVKSLLTDICDASSHLHRAYSENYQCLKNVLNNVETAEACSFQAAMWYYRYKVRSGSRDTSDAKCLIEANFLGCMANKVEDSCGDYARFFVIESMKRTKLIKVKFCTPRQIHHLQNGYLDLLDLGATERNIYQNAFDLRRKKK